MNRFTKSLAAAALTAFGALAVTAAQASAANFVVHFSVQNNDAAATMIRTSPDTSVVVGLTDPAAEIFHGATDPTTGYATYSDTLPTTTSPKSTNIVYGAGPSGSGSSCTFTITLSKDMNPQPYKVTFTTTDAVRCPVPASARSSTGDFSAVTYAAGWRT